MLTIKIKGLSVPIPRHVEAGGHDAMMAYVEDKTRFAEKLRADESTTVIEEEHDDGRD